MGAEYSIFCEVHYYFCPHIFWYIISVLASVSKYLFIISSNKVIDIVTNGISQEIGRLTIGDLPWLQKA